MARHTDKTTARSLNIFSAAQPKLNSNVVQTAESNQLDASMFVEFTQKRNELQKSIKASEASYGRLSSDLLNQNDTLQGEIDKAFNNPFHDLLAAFSDDRSTDELLQDQRRLAMQLSRINTQNVSATASIQGDIDIADQKFKDQIGLSELIAKGADRQLIALESVTKSEQAATTLEIKKLERKSVNMLLLELQDPNSIFSPGLTRSVLNAKINDNLLTQTNQLKLKFGGSTKAQILGSISKDQMVEIVKNMKNLGVTSQPFNGVVIPIGDFTKAIAVKQKDFERDINIFNTLSSDALASINLQPDAQAFADTIDTTSLSIETQVQMQTAAATVQFHQKIQKRNTDILAGGNKLTTRDSLMLIRSGKQAFEVLSITKDRASTEKANAISSDEPTQKALKNYFMSNGRFNSAKEAQTVGIELLSSSTPEAVGSQAGGIFQKTVTSFAKLVQDRIDSNFDNNFTANERSITNRAGSKRSVNIEDFLKGQPANKKLSSVEWLRALREPALDKDGKPVLPGSGLETNRWKAGFVNSAFAIQIDQGISEFVTSDAIKLQPKIIDLLTTSGGRLKDKYLNSSDTLKSIIADLTTLNANDIINEKVDKDTDYAAMFIQTMKSASIMNVGANAFTSSKDPFLNSMFRNLYGDRDLSSIAGGYLQKYENKLSSMPTKELINNAVFKLIDTSEQGTGISSLLPDKVNKFFNEEVDILGNTIR